MRISDWSSDVCSSDLEIEGDGVERDRLRQMFVPDLQPHRGLPRRGIERGAAADREGETEEKEGRDRARPCDEREQCRDDQHSRRSEEHTSELQSLMRISYAVFCLKKKNYKQTKPYTIIT